MLVKPLDSPGLLNKAQDFDAPLNLIHVVEHAHLINAQTILGLAQPSEPLDPALAFAHRTRFQVVPHGPLEGRAPPRVQLPELLLSGSRDYDGVPHSGNSIAKLAVAVNGLGLVRIELGDAHSREHSAARGRERLLRLSISRRPRGHVMHVDDLSAIVGRGAEVLKEGIEVHGGLFALIRNP